MPLGYLVTYLAIFSNLILFPKLQNVNYINTFIDRLSTATWSAVEDEHDAQVAYDIFHGIFFNTFDEAFPFQRQEKPSTQANDD